LLKVALVASEMKRDGSRRISPSCRSFVNVRMRQESAGVAVLGVAGRHRAPHSRIPCALNYESAGPPSGAADGAGAMISGG